jgi:hypothetical protein
LRNFEKWELTAAINDANSSPGGGFVITTIARQSLPFLAPQTEDKICSKGEDVGE